MSLVGRILNNKYEVLKLIGKGGMSNVYLAMDLHLNKQWAIKEIHSGNLNQELLLQSLTAEVNLMKKLDHPALPRIVDVVKEGDLLYVVMDYIEGEPLSKIVKMFSAQPQELVIDWGKQLCLVLHYLHSRKPPIIYRDMKPSNIMLCPGGNLKLIDFGIAREYKKGGHRDTVNLGTKGYAAPEQFGNNVQTDERTDIYCLGVTLYYLLTNLDPDDQPFELQPIRTINPNLSGGLEKIIQTCIKPKPEERYQSALEVLYDLGRYQEIDDNYRKKQKKILHRFIKCVVIAVCFFSISFTFFLVNRRTALLNYENVLKQARMSADLNRQKELYLQAIDINPKKIEPYMQLIQLYKEDALYTLEEQEQFLGVVMKYEQDIKENEGYVSLAFQLGNLYWYYYDYGTTHSQDNQVTRMKSSIPWFEKVLQYGNKENEYYNMARIYYNIGIFNRDINLAIEEASDKGSYATYWNNLKEMYSLLEQDQESDIVKLELYKVITNAIELYARKFKGDGIIKEDLLKYLNHIIAKTEELSANTDKTISIKTYIISRKDNTMKSIVNAYTLE